MAARLAPDDEPDTGRSNVAECPSADLVGTSFAVQGSARRLCLAVDCGGPYCLGGGVVPFSRVLK
jgi:hypothetical protein